MGTNEFSQPASKSSWDSQDFGDVNVVLKWPIFTSPPDHNELIKYIYIYIKYGWNRDGRFFHLNLYNQSNYDD